MYIASVEKINGEFSKKKNDGMMLLSKTSSV